MNELTNNEIMSLIHETHANLEKAYAPYSNFPVASIVLMKDGTIFTGVNIENASYGATNCAERTAIFTAVANGYRKGDFAAIFIAGKTAEVLPPCSICRQVFIEFFDETMPVFMTNKFQEYKQLTVADLVPYTFMSDNLEG